MPRRPPPSSLLLVKGPPPTRAEPKHRLPSVPQPTFYPCSNIAEGRKRQLDDAKPKHRTIVQGRRGSTAHENHHGDVSLSRTSSNQSADEMMLPNTITIPPRSASPSQGSPSTSTRESRTPEERTLVGPWDRSRDFQQSSVKIDSLLPKPAQATIVQITGGGGTGV